MADLQQENIATTTDSPVTYASSPFNDADADVILRSSDNVYFKVFKLLLSMGSPLFKDMFSLPQPPTSSEDGAGETKGGVPVIQVTETAKILRMLLSMCYPMGAVDQPALDKLEDVDLLLDAALKYSVERVEKRAREALIAPPCMQGNEVRVFAIACHHGMEVEAKAAARALLEQPILDMECGPELELLSAAKFFRLLKYHTACVKAARGAIANLQGTNTAPSSIAMHCNSCNYQRTFQPVAGKANITLAILERIPSKKEIEKATETGGSMMSCTSCGQQKSTSTVQSSRELAASYIKELEDAISAVALDLQL
ncbi:hypothetical protein HWV62_11493 [Athelia sp. TMB]|nr:hypothetical protein HWV62_11493 [Athelia sp. TMB]